MTTSITIHQFARGLGLPNPSPFCMKTEGILKLCQLDYEVKVQNDPRSAPMGKLPFISHNNHKIADSHLIIRYLREEFGCDLDSHLSESERAIHHAMHTMMDERLYFVLLFSRWGEDENWELLRDQLFAPIPKLIRKLIANRIREGLLSDLKAQGVGRHSSENIYQMGISDITALASFLGENHWFGGGKPCVLDVTAVTYLANFLIPELHNPVRDFIREQPALVAYTKRGIETIFGEDYAF